jgi:hypothetical protein
LEDEVIYAKVMPSPITKGEIIVSLICDNKWIGFVRKMNANFFVFNITCQELANAWKFHNYSQVESLINSLQNLGLNEITTIWAMDNKELTSL